MRLVPGYLRSLLVGSVVLAAVLAGCIQGDQDGSSSIEDDCERTDFEYPDIQIKPTTHDPIADLSVEEMWFHDHRNLRTCSLPAIGHHPLREGDPHNYLGEIDMRGDLDLGAVAVLGNQEKPMVYILDISDRASPQILSVIEEDNTYIVDVKFSEDGAYLFTSSQNVPTNPEFDNLPQLTGPTGFTVYDISDPADPQWELTVPDPQFGCHMMSHKIIGGVDVLFCVSQQIRAYRLDRTPDGLVVLGFVDYIPTKNGVPTPSNPPLVGGLVPPEGRPVRDLVFNELTNSPHDMTVQEDPVDGRTYAFVSHWNSGLRIVDVTDLPQMTEVGIWEGEGAVHYDGNVHTAMMFYVGEDRYVAATPEYTYGGVVPSLWVFDANDYSDLKLVGEWYHPNEHDAQGLFLTLHQWQVAPTGSDITDPSEVRFYITYNHAGVWVLDLGAILEGDNWGAILGYNLARQDILDPDEHPGNVPLNTWDVNVVDGYIYGSDRGTGLWIFHYEGDELGDPRVTGFA
jgi:hypothetical protein